MPKKQFGQNAKLVNVLRDILNNYSENGLIKEMVQNADDAGAKTVKVILCLDEWEEGGKGGADEGFRGPALYVYNDEVFTEEDLASIQDVGGSCKELNLEKTGRFGIGFNSVYHVSDMPSLLTNSTVCYFDPSCERFPSGGLQYDFSDPSDAALIKGSASRFAPLSILGWDPSTAENFPGTLFRLPLRTVNHAETSPLRSTPCTPDGITDILTAFQKESEKMLLFLKSVSRIEIAEYSRNTGLTTTHSVELAGMSAEDVASRGFHKKLPKDRDVKARLVKLRSTNVVVDMTVAVRRMEHGEEAENTWRIYQSTGEGTACEVSCDQRAVDYKKKLLPWGGIAVNLTTPITPLEGLAFCFLPLPEATNLPVHCNGYFEVPSNRGNICYGTDDSGEARFKSEWNTALLTDVIPHAYIELIKWAVATKNPIIYSMIPLKSIREPWGLVSSMVLKKLGSTQCIDCGPHGWLAPQECYFAAPDESSELLSVLRTAGVPLSAPPPHVTDTLCPPSQRLTVQAVCDVLLSKKLVVGTNWSARAACVVLDWILTKLGADLPPHDSPVSAAVRSLPLAVTTSSTVAAFEGKLWYAANETVLRFVKRTPAGEVVLEVGGYEKLGARLGARDCQDFLGVKVVSGSVDVFELLPVALKECKRHGGEEKVTDLGVVEKCKAFWEAVAEFDKTLSVPEGWGEPGVHWLVIPCNDYCCSLNAGSVLLGGDTLPESILPTLTAIGVDITTVFVPTHVKPATPSGILQALHATRGAIPSAHSAPLLSWLRAVHPYIPDDLHLAAALPIWSLYSAPSEAVQLDPPKDFKIIPSQLLSTPLEKVLSGEYVVVDKALHKVLEGAGVVVEDAATVWVEEFLEKAAGLADGRTVDEFVQVVVQAVVAAEEHRAVRSAIQHAEVFPSKEEGSEGKVVYKAVSALFDPNAHRVAPFLLPGRVLDMEMVVKHSGGRLLQLGALGLKNTLDKAAVIEVATDLQDAKFSDFDKATQLLRYLNDNIDEFSDRCRTGFFNAVKRLTTSTEAEQQFFANLGRIAWFPSLRTHPHLPFTPPATLLPAHEVRPLTDLPLCCFHKGILPIPVDNLTAHDFFKWNQTGLSSDTLTRQLLSLAAWHKAEAKSDTHVRRAAEKIYASLTEHLKANTIGEALNLLEGKDFIWVEGQGFVSPTCVAQKSPAHGLPGLYQLEPGFRQFRALFEMCGVNEEFSAASYAEGLGRLQAMRSDAKLEPTDLRIVIAVLVTVPDLGGHPIYVPDEDSVLRKPGSLVYNDREWADVEEMGAETYVVHKNISREVAFKLGIVTLRDATGEVTEFGDGEAYGQSESITDRIKNVIKDYVNDIGILHESVQNADDSGATEQVFILDKMAFGKVKLLDAEMGNWQGPALLSFNNKTFTDGDFKNLAEIGKGNKTQDVAKTGKFGLGFNAVYQFTDVPSFVSGGYIVMLDPHRKYLTRYTKANAPGYRVALPSRTITKYPDQFTPYKIETPYFKCDLEDPFNGTLFRFPLRDAETAKRSDIKNAAYSVEEAEGLLKEFCDGAEELLLFLRHLRSIRVMVREGDGTVREMFSISKEVDAKGAREMENVYNFVAGRTGGSTKEDFKNRLSETKDSDLPSALAKCTVRRAVAGKKQVIDEWVVSAVIGGGDAKKLAVEADASQRLVPWAGAALRRSRDGAFIPINGKAFCVLPLPSTENTLRTGFHVNGLFELSSNRRNLWMDDFKTGGKSSWNVALITDGCVPAALKLVKHLQKDKKLAVDDYYSVLPLSMSGVWGEFTSAFYAKTVEQPLLHSQGRWICIKDAKFPKNDTPAYATALLEYLGTLVVRVPRSELLDTFGEVTLIDSDLMRDVLKSEPLENAEPKPDEMMLKCALSFCAKDLGSAEKPWDLIQGVPLLKLMDGRMVKFGSLDDEPVYLALQKDLVTPTVTHLFADVTFLRGAGVLMAFQLSKTPVANIKPLSHRNLAVLYPQMFPGISGMASVGRDNHAAPSEAWLSVFWNMCRNDRSFEWQGDVVGCPLLPTKTKIIAYSAREKVLQRNVNFEECFAAFGVETLDSMAPMSVLPRHSTAAVVKALHLTHGSGLAQRVNEADEEARTKLLQCIEDGSSACPEEALQEVSRVFAQLPIFPSRVEGVSLPVAEKYFLAPRDANADLVPRHFYSTTGLTVAAREKRTNLLTALGINVVAEDDYLLRHLIPALSDEEEPTEYKTTVADHILKEAVAGKFDSAGLRKEMSKMQWVQSKSGEYKAPVDLVDQSVAQSHGVTIPDMLVPDQKYSLSKGSIKTLRDFGLKQHVSGDHVRAAASTVRDGKSAQSLITYFIRTKRDPEELQDCLKGLKDCPLVWVANAPPDPSLAWDSELIPENRLMPPSATRPLRDMYLCSYSYGLAVDSPVECMQAWYSKRVPSTALAVQLKMCGELNVPYLVVRGLYCEIAKRLKDADLRNEMKAALLDLQGCKTVYVGREEGDKGRYCIPERVSLVTMDIRAEPYLGEIPSECLADWVGDGKLVSVRVALGVKKHFDSSDYAPILSELGNRGDKLSDPELHLCIDIAKYVASEGGAVAYLPNGVGELKEPSELGFDVSKSDAYEPQLVHPEIPHDVAKHFNVGSEQAKTNADIMKPLSADKTVSLDSVIKYASSMDKSGVRKFVSDVLQLAHDKPSGVVFVHDTTKYTSPLVIPGTDEFRDEALVIHFEQAFKEEEILKLFDKSFKVKGIGGLGGCFTVADGVEVAIGNHLVFHRPLDDKSVWYKLGDIGRYFASHFETLLHYTRYGTTLRLPLRKKKSSIGDVCTPETLRSALRAMTTHIPATLPFTCINKVSYQERTPEGLRDVMSAQAVLAVDHRQHMWSWIPPNDTVTSSSKDAEVRNFIVDVHVTGEDAESREAKIDKYRWGVCMMSGVDGSRKLGNEYTKPPVGGVAALLQFNEEQITHEWLKMASLYMKPVCDSDETPNLPVQIFSNELRGNPKWNAAVKANIWGAYVNLLQELCKTDTFGKELPSPNACYNYWPSHEGPYSEEVRTKVYAKVSSSKLYLHKGAYIEPSKPNVKFITSEMSPDVISTVAKEVDTVYDTAAHVGKGVTTDKKSGKTQGFTPADARKLCSRSPAYGVVGKLGKPAQVVELLSLAVSDLTEATAHELGGAHLLPLVGTDGNLSIEPFGTKVYLDKRVYLGTTEMRKLFEGIDSSSVTFIHPEVLKNRDLYDKLSSEGFKREFNIRTPDVREIVSYLEKAAAHDVTDPPAVWQGRETIDCEEAKELPEEWLTNFWRISGGAEAQGWPLLPLEDGSLVDAGLVTGAFIFKAGEPTEDGHSESDAGEPTTPEATPPTHADPTAEFAVGEEAPKSLHEFDPRDFRVHAEALGVPILAADFSGKTNFQPAGTPPQVIATKLAALTSINAINWGGVTAEAKAGLVSYFARHVNDFRPRFAKTFLKSLPIFEALGGEESHTAIGEGCEAAPRSPFFRPDSGWVVNHEKELLTTLGVVSREETEVWRTKLLPELAKDTADADGRYEQLLHIREHYEEYEADDALVSYLKETPLFPNNEGKLYKPADFLHPSLVLVKDVFGDGTEHLPHGRYSEIDWLPFLEDLGMQSEVTAEVFLRCAREIDSARDEVPPPGQIVVGARSLLKKLTEPGMWEGFCEERFCKDGTGFKRAILGLHIMPARQPRGEETKLYKYSNCCLPAFKFLVPFSMPIINDDWVPAQPKELGVEEPKLARIVESLEHANLEKYPFDSDPAEDFARTLDFLKGAAGRDPAWKTLKNKVTAAACVPVGGLLGCPDYMYKRTQVQLPPFVMEVPRVYEKQTEVLLELGAGESFGAGEAGRVVKRVGERRKGTALTPTELNSYLKLVEQTVKEGMRDKVEYVPNSDCVLKKISELSYSDSPWLLESVQGKVPFVHDRMGGALCEKLQVKPLSHIIRHNMIKMGGREEVDEEMMQKIGSEEFAAAVKDLYAVRGIVIDQHQLHVKLQKCRVVELDKIVTTLMDTATTTHVTEASETTLSFIEYPPVIKDKPKGFTTIYLRANLPPTSPRNALIAQSLFEITKLPSAPLVSELLSAEPCEMREMMKALRAVPPKPSDMGHRGVPGRDVLLIEVLLPPRGLDKPTFLPGECIAFVHGEGHKYGEVRRVVETGAEEVPFKYSVDVGLGKLAEKLPMEVCGFGGFEEDVEGEGEEAGDWERADPARDAIEDMANTLAMLTDRLGVELDSEKTELMAQISVQENELKRVHTELETANQRAADSEESQTCGICITKPRNTCLTPCGHLFCHECAAAVRECPYCRSRINTRTRMIL